MRVLFIVNPVAGKGHAAKIVPQIKSIMESMNEVDFNVEYTKAPKHAVEIAKKHSSGDYDIVFAVGGDGTVNEVVNGLVGSDTALGVLPGGSGNDFIRSLNISGDMESILRSTIKGQKKLIDVGTVNGRYFVNISSAGFDAEVVLATQRAKKYFLSGSAAYIAGLISTVFTKSSVDLRVVYDGGEINERALLVAVANGRYYGGGMLAAPDALLDDGAFDLCFISETSKLRLLTFFPMFIKGQHKGLKEVSFYRSRNVHIESPVPVSINIDGEVIRDTKVDFQIENKKLFVAVPESSIK